jgi:hypothetical protein
MIKAKFLQDIQGSLDGINNKQFKKDCVYSVNGSDINEYLFTSWLNKGILEVYEEKMLPKFENKAIFNSPANKVEELIETIEEIQEEPIERNRNTNKKNRK